MTTKRSTRGVITALLAASLLVLFASAASAQGDYPPTGTLTLDKTTVPQGGEVTATMTGCAPGADVHFVLNSDPVDLGVRQADADGVATITFQVPTGFPTGAHTVTSSCLAPNGEILVLSAELTVTAAGGDSGGTTGGGGSGTGTLPRTGSDSTNLLRVGALLVAAGGAVVLITRKRSANKVTA